MNYLKFLPLIILSVPCMSKASEITLFSSMVMDISDIYSSINEGVATRARLDAGFTADLSSVLPEQSVFSASYSLRRGDNGSDFTGDIQSFSNIDADDYSHWMEIYFGIPLSAASQLKLGYMDATGDFLAPKFGGGFINASMGFSPTTLGISTFPLPNLGIYIDYQLTENILLKYGYYAAGDTRTDFGKNSTIVEASWRYASNNYLRFGYWRHSAIEQSAQVYSATSDFYLVVDHEFSRQVNGFFQYGDVQDSLSEVNRHISIGINYTDFWTKDHSLGFMASRVDVTSFSQETVYEFYYNYELSSSVSIKPGYIYILNPSGNSHLKNAQVINLRLSLNF